MPELWIVVVIVAGSAGFIATCVSGALLGWYLFKRYRTAIQNRSSIKEAPKANLKPPVGRASDSRNCSDLEKGQHLEPSRQAIERLEMLEKYLKLELQRAEPHPTVNPHGDGQQATNARVELNGSYNSNAYEQLYLGAKPSKAKKLAAQTVAEAAAQAGDLAAAQTGDLAAAQTGVPAATQIGVPAAAQTVAIHENQMPENACECCTITGRSTKDETNPPMRSRTVAAVPTLSQSTTINPFCHDDNRGQEGAAAKNSKRQPRVSSSQPTS